MMYVEEFQPSNKCELAVQPPCDFFPNDAAPVSAAANTTSRRAYPEKIFSHDRVLPNLLRTEDRYSVNSNYFRLVQSDIQPYMRKMVVTWMYEVFHEKMSMPETFPHAVNLLDRFLSVQDIPRQQFQLVAASCMLLASKLREAYPLTTHQLVIYTDNSVTLQDLLAAELLVLSRLRWDVSALTPYDFIEPLLQRLSLEGTAIGRIRRNAQAFIALCICDNSFIAYPSSLLAAACICYASFGELNQTSAKDLLPQLVQLIQADKDAFVACLELVKQVLLQHKSQCSRAKNNQYCTTSPCPPISPSTGDSEAPTTPTDPMVADRML